VMTAQGKKPTKFTSPCRKFCMRNVSCPSYAAAVHLRVSKMQIYMTSANLDSASAAQIMGTSAPRGNPIIHK
jgi:hypothetical protein